MRRRSFTPDALGRMEERVMPAPVAGLSHGPVALSGLQFNTAIGQVKNDFELFATSGDVEKLRSMLAEHTQVISFHQVDGLGARINAILARMQSDLASGRPRSIEAAHRGVVDAMRSDVRARIQGGTIIIVR